MRWLVVLIITFAAAFKTSAQFTISGEIINGRDSLPIPNATIQIPTFDIWTISNERGFFQLPSVPAGKIRLLVRCLGFVPASREIELNQNIRELKIILKEDNLLLNEVVVTAKQGEKDLATSFVLDRKVLDHMQMLNIADATSLLPGGKTNKTLHLATGASQQISLIGSGAENGNPNFGVGIEVDGVRLSNNSLPGSSPGGSDVRNITTSNIESIEIVTGIPSVEHGDATNGMVRINTRKGASSFILDLVTKPNTKQVALSKGLDFGKNRGVLNANIEHTRSVSDLASPYTSYGRNSLSLNYSNVLASGQKSPVEINVGITGNLGGYNNQSDPDRFVNTYSKTRDNLIRGNVSGKWLLNRSWITNLEVAGTFNYNDQQSEVMVNRSTSSSIAAIHAMDEGYHVGQTYDQNPDADIILLQPGYWYERSFSDSKLVNYSGKIKANWATRWGAVDNHLMAGAEYTGSGNLGRGSYYEDLRYAPTWREYRYDQIPFNNNYAFYLEDRLLIPFFQRAKLLLTSGLRSDITSIRNSVYGIVQNVSPRFNAEYVFWEKSKQTVENLSIKVGWGKTVKLPSFGMLFPSISYRDILTFAPGTTDDGSTYYAYYSIPTIPEYNPGLKWQYNIQQELGINTRINGTRIFVSFAKDQTFNPYGYSTTYKPFTYKFTDQRNLENSAIPISNRVYEVDQQTGVVTVTDKTGVLPTETLGYKEITRFQSNGLPVNNSPATRHRMQWIIDFKKIQSLKTQVRIDGNWYRYRSVEETISAYMPNSTLTMADGNPYKYVGYFVGGAQWKNGTQTETVTLNVTGTTHIPALRLIFTARIEATLRNYEQYLSESSKGKRGFVLAGSDSYLPMEGATDIYAGNQYIGVYPEYYLSLDDMSTRIPFEEKFLWAKVNDTALYNELAKMVIRTNYNYSFNPMNSSAYFSANLGITKEIGRVATITFNAINFLSNMARVYQSQTQTNYSLFESSSIPSFYYGLSLRLKW